MKTFIKFAIFFGLIYCVQVSAQVLSEKQLALIVSDQITAMQEAKAQATDAFKGSGFVTVGSDVACDYDSGNTRIQDAIDDGHTEIRIAEDTYEENVIIDDVDVQLLGGYANCTEAQGGTYNPNSTATTISPLVGSGNPAIRVSGNSQRNNLTLRNLTIQRGEDNGFFSAGGIAFLNADYAVSMNKLNINQNNGLLGGGVSIIAGNTDIDMYNVVIGANYASADGGGLFCTGPNNSIIFDSEDANSAAGFINNSTDGNGGGVYLADSCSFSNFVGTGPNLDFRGMLSNKAADHGGAIYAETGAKVYLRGNLSCSFTFPITCNGYNTEPVNLSGNIADNNNDNTGNGGAVYATGADTAVYATNMRVNLNSADDGGAVAVNDGALFQTSTSYFVSIFFNTNTCWDNGRCNQYTENKASETSGYGGAFFAENGGRINITRTHIEANRADLGAAVYLRNLNTELNMEGAYITGNGSADADGYLDGYPIRVFTDASARIDYTTIADNEVDPGSASLGNSGGSLRIYSSIVHDLSGAPALSESSPVASTERCLIVNDMGDVTNSSYNLVDDPEFVDRGNNDYHIDAMFSPAVDYCDETQSGAQHTTQDTDQEDRGWDDYVANNNFQGSYFDVGADETYQNDVIFKDDFE